MIETVLYWTAVCTLIVALLTFLPSLEGPPAWLTNLLGTRTHHRLDAIVVYVFFVSVCVSAIAFVTHSTYLYLTGGGC